MIYSEHIDSLRISCTTSKPLGELNMMTIYVKGLGILFPGADFVPQVSIKKSKSSVSEVSIKTGTIEDAGTLARALLEICDDEGNCCNTSQSGLGLDNPGTTDRVRGGTDVYSDKAVLGTCSEVNILNLALFYFNLHLLIGAPPWCTKYCKIDTH